jgi:thiol-disulfide isomerase/thioredoxin
MSEVAEPAHRNRSRVLRDAVVLVVVLGALAFLVFRPTSDKVAPGRNCDLVGNRLLGEGQAMPGSCTLEAFGGGASRSLAQIQDGRPMVINFWATYCAPCVKEMPGYQQVYAAGAGRFELVGVNPLGAFGPGGGESRDASRDFAQQLGVRYPLLYDGDWLLFRHFNKSPTLPTTVFVRPDGVIAHVRVGPYDPAALAEGVRTYLGVDVRV